MNRRDFIKAAAAGAAAVAAPLINQLIDASALASVPRFQFVMNGAQLDNGFYVCVMHPSCANDLRNMLAREQWAFAYRAWRMDGKPPMSCAGILDRYKPTSKTVDWNGEIGSFESFRFIESGTLA